MFYDLNGPKEEISDRKVTGKQPDSTLPCDPQVSGKVPKEIKTHVKLREN